MGFLNNLVRNRALIENLSREPMAQRIDPISTNPFGNFPILPMPMPQVPQPIQQAVPPTPLPSVIEDIEDIRIPFMPNEKPITFTPPQLPPVFEQPIIAPPVAIPPSLPDPVPLERLPIQSPRDEQIFVPPRNIVDRDIPREILPPVLPPFVPPPIAPPPVDRPILERPIIPPRRDDFMSIERIDEPRDEFIPRMPNEEPIPFIPPVIPQTPVAPPINIGGPPLDTSLIPQREILERPIIPPRRDDFMSIGGPGGRVPDPRVDEGVAYLGGSPTFNEQGSVEAGNALQDFINNQDNTVQPAPTTPIQPIIQEPVIPPVSVDPVIDSASVSVEPAPVEPVVTPTAAPVQTIPQDVRGQVDPVLAQQDAREIQTDPLLRALYFGTADQPGYLNQLQQATANLIGSDVPLQQTAGLSNLEQMAQDRAIADLGVAEPFVGERADLLRGTTRQFDPNMTQQFFNPYEDRVVQQTIQDVLEAGEKRDIAQRAQDIQTGGLSAFGSRARLTAADRQEALGRGLAEALGGIRQAGFTEAQRSALSTFDRQRLAEQQAATGIGQVGTQLADLRASERAGLAGFGQTGRGIEETGLARLFQQQVDAQGRPLQALQVTGQLLPQFQAGSTQIDSQYRLPVDPSAQGLGAAFSAYSALAPKQGTA